MFDVSPDGANFWFDISNLVLLVGAVLVALGTYGTIRFAGIKEKFSDERTAALETQTEQAKAELGVAQANIAKANAQIATASTEAEKAIAETAKANERTAELKLALEREIAERQPRTIDPKAKATIVALLKGDRAPKGRIVVLWKLFDEEAEQFAKQIIDVLKESGFDAVEGTGPMGFKVKGAWIVVRDFAAASATPNALGAVQAAFRNVLHIELDGKQRTEGFPDEDAVIAIGPKP